MKPCGWVFGRPARSPRRMGGALDLIEANSATHEPYDMTGAEKHLAAQDAVNTIFGTGSQIRLQYQEIRVRSSRGDNNTRRLESHGRPDSPDQEV